MAITRTRTRDNTVDATASGMDINAQNRGDWLQNLYSQNGSLIVREGFGQVNRYASTLTTNTNIVVSGVSRGFEEILGSYYIDTDFGHEQIITVIKSVVWTADNGSTTLSGTKNIYSVLIYDITTDTRKELTIYETTAANQSEQLPMFQQYGHYETTHNTDRQTWAESKKEKVFFTEYADRLFFGTETMGAYFYTPSIFTEDHKNVEGSVTRTWEASEHESTYRSEDLCIQQVVFNPNKVFQGETVNEDGSLSILYTYATSSDITKITDATTFDGRIVWASGRSLFFSDVNKPNSVAAPNFVSLDSENEITAVLALRDSIVVWTDNETFMYLPSNDPFIVSAGRLYNLSSHVGCLGPQSKIRVGNAATWSDRNGFWTAVGNTKIDKLSDRIDPFFNTEVSRPMTNFFSKDGGNQTRSSGQKINLDTAHDELVVMCYEPEEERLFFTYPERNFAWVLDAGGFKVWTWETVATNQQDGDGKSLVETTENIKKPFMVSNNQGGLYIVGREDETVFTTDRRDQLVSNGYGATYILEWKRGGGVDRTSSFFEDSTVFTGEFVETTLSSSQNAYLVIDKPVKLSELTPNYSYFNPTSAATAAENTFLLPIRIIVQNHPRVTDVNFEFTYDKDNFSFQIDPNSTGGGDILCVVPTERVASASGWALGQGIFPGGATQSYAAVFQGASADPNGDTVKLKWNGANGGFTARPWSYSAGGVGQLNFAEKQVTTLLYLVMRMEANPSGTRTTPKFTPTVASYTPVGGAATGIKAMAWQATPYDNNAMTTADAKQQPVEWVFKTRTIGDGDVNIKARGITSTMVSTGNATTSIFPNWAYRLYNSLLGSDQKEYASQVVDYTDPDGSLTTNIQNIKNIANKNTVVARLRSAPYQATVNNSYGSSQAKWASTQAGTDGTVLVSNNAENNITQSDSVRGGRLSYTLFGFVMSKAERVRFNVVRATIRAIGAMRRR
jgi:hypothetical protein|tara:strand:+ start:759 stop:3638 length:2880 start_codon:yes stop_codon:yes gene_type:complete